MPKTVNILCAENIKDDYNLILIVLQKAAINVFSQRVENAIDFNKALKSDIKWDVILSDYIMPGFGGLDALKIYKTFNLNAPFIVVSGSITDVEAVAILKAGANDYVSKEKLLRLPSAIKREIEQAIIRQKLKESENRWKIALEGTTDGLWDINLKTKKVFYSKEWKAMLGYKDHEIEDKVEAWEDLVHPDDLKRVEAHSKRHIENKIPSFYNEYRMRCKNGSYKWILDRGKIIERAKDGEPLRMMGIHSDIDARKILEEELLESQRIAKLGSYSLDLINLKATTSPTFDSITGYGSLTAKNFKQWRKIVHPDDVSGNQEMLEECIKTGVVWEREYRIIKEDTKEIKWIYGKGEIVFEEELPSKFVGIIQDITKRKLDEEKIKRNELKLIEFQNITHLGTFVFDDSTDLFETSAICDYILGIDKHYKKNIQGWINFIYPDDFQEAQALLDDNSVKNIFKEFRVIRPKDKKVIWVLGSVAKEFDSKGKRFKITGTIQDITKRKRDEITKQVIYNITKKAGTTHNLTDISNYIKTELAQLIDTTNFFIALYNEDTDMISTPFMVDEQDDGSDFPKGKTLTGYLIDNKIPILASNKDLLKLKTENNIALLGPLSQCWLGVPLLVENKVIGAIVIQSYKDENAYTNEDVNLLELIAINISQIIKHAENNNRINFLNQVLTQSPESIVVTNLNGDIEYVNPAFTALSGYESKEVLGKNPRILNSGKQDKIFYKKLWGTITNGKIWRGEFYNKNKNGKEYLVNANIAAVKNSKGAITHFVAVEEDITEKRKLERDFLHAFIDAQEVEKQSFGEELHDGVSQILSAQTMFVDVLQKLTKDDTGKITEYLENIKELNTKAINETRTIAHGLMSKELQENGLIMAVAQICKDYSTSRDMNFSFSCKGIEEAEINPEIKTNIFRIIQEVSTNTVRHSLAKEAQVYMSKTNKNQLKVFIKDNGVGIDFERNKVNNKGTGLENIKRRITLLNGKIDLKSDIDIGTQYTLLIPLDNIL